MKLIETTKEMRNYYEQHLAQLDKMASMSVEKRKRYYEGLIHDENSLIKLKSYYNCFMCDAGLFSSIGDMCNKCPLSIDRQNGMTCDIEVREINLVDAKGNSTHNYGEATPESITKHADWIADQITKYTDCEMV